jgi:hypothetical protein
MVVIRAVLDTSLYVSALSRVWRLCDVLGVIWRN